MSELSHLSIAPADADAIVIGGGPNGLACAGFLAASNKRVLLLESGASVGGLCRTSEIIPGYSTSTFAHWPGPLDANLVKTLRLAKFGLTFSDRRLSQIALSEDGRHIAFDGNARRTVGDIKKHSETDARHWPVFDAAARKLASNLTEWLTEPPVPAPQQKGGFSAPSKMKPLDDSGRAALAPYLLRSIADVLDEQFESDALKGAIAFDAILGSGLTPRTPGTALRWFAKLSSEAGRAEALAHPLGGMGALTNALRATAMASGVTIRTNASVEKVVANDGRVTHVVLHGGEALYAPLIVSSLEKRRTLHDLVGSRFMPFGEKRALRHGLPVLPMAKLNLALRGMPVFPGLDRNAMRSRFLIGASMSALERSCAAAIVGETPPEMPIEFMIPSAHDPGLTPANDHVLSALIAVVPSHMTDAEQWLRAKDQLVKQAIATLGQYCPDLASRVLAAEIFGPPDFAQVSEGSHGHWSVPFAAQIASRTRHPYASPIQGLYFCGADTHPNLGITGLSARNAAAAIMSDEAAMSGGSR
jgi:phytoene dehydrogenase-like protein